MADDDAIRLAKKWLDNTGYPLEMRTLAAFQQHGIAEGSRYIPGDDGRLREIDVHVTLHGPYSRQEPRVVVSLPVECKAGPRGFPWIAFVDGQSRMTRDNDIYDCMEKDIWRMSHADVDNAYDCPLLTWAGPVAYNVVEAKGNDETRADSREDRPYRAVQQITAAVDGLMRDRMESVTEPTLRLFIPIIVTDAPIVTCRLDEDGQPAYEAVERVLWVTRPRQKAQLSALWLWSATDLTGLAKAAAKTAQRLRPKRQT